jgi:hypothetical protein
VPYDAFPSTAVLYAAFGVFEPPLWFIVLFLGLMFAPAAIGGAILGVAVRRVRGGGPWPVAAIVGALSGCIVAEVGSRLVFAGFRGVVSSDDFFWTSVAVGIASAVLAIALLILRRPPSAAEHPGKRAPDA